MICRRLLVFILGLVAAIAPARASLSWNIGNNSNSTLNNAISSWDTASGFDYLLEDTTFTGTLGGTPSTYTDALSDALFGGFKLSGGANGATDNLAISGTALQQTTSGGIIEISDFPTSVYAFGAEFALTSYLPGSGFCFEVNQSSYNQSSNCDNTFAILSSGDVAFVGVVSSVPITSIWVGPSANQTETIQINNFDIPGQDDSAPEGSTMVLLGSGLILLGAIRFRKRVWARSAQFARR